MAVIDTLVAIAFLVALSILFIIVPMTLAYFLIKHRFMSDRLRYSFAGVLMFDVAFILFLVLLDLIAKRIW